jgi:hypothetical protein
VDVRNSLDFSLYIGYNDIAGCDVRQEVAGRFASDIVIQHHDMVVTGADVGLKVWSGARFTKFQELFLTRILNAILNRLTIDSKT